MLLNVPNSITALRLLLVPFLLIFGGLPYYWAAWVTMAIFAVGALSDWLDGFLARHLNQASAFGAFLDPVADKLIVMSGLVLLLNRPHPDWYMWVTVIIVGREIAMSALREWMALMGVSGSVSVSYLGKLKTTFQGLAITFLLVPERNILGKWALWLGEGVLLVALLLTLWSLGVYAKRAFLTMKGGIARSA